MQQFSKRESRTVPIIATVNSHATNWVCMMRVRRSEGGTRDSAHNSAHGDHKLWQVIVVLGELMVSLEGRKNNRSYCSLLRDKAQIIPLISLESY